MSAPTRALALTTSLLSLVTPLLTHADTTVFTDRAAWEAAVVGIVQTENFDAITPFALPADGTSAVGLVSVETTNGTAAFGVRAGADANNINGTPFLFLAPDGSPVRSAALIFPQPVTAWGMDWSEFIPADDVQISFGTDIDASIFSLTGAHSGFVGFITDTPITRVEVTDPFISFVNVSIDNLSFVEPPAPLSIGHAVFIEFDTAAGKSYTIESSPDMTNWTIEEVVTGSGATESRFFKRDSDNKFYRVLPG